MLEEMEAAGSKLPMMVKTLQDNGWKNHNHHDNWVKGELAGEYDTHEAYSLQMGINSTTVSQAIDRLIKALKEDEGYWDSWKANIAMSIHDEWYSQDWSKVKGTDAEGELIHKVFNNGAERFLQLLVNQKDNENRYSM